ncbi:MAG: hypothetical protein LBP85_01900 [Prevotellaceae bacterium]|nr:hypothetical protein [Prevotellaceae bacterium]
MTEIINFLNDHKELMNKITDSIENSIMRDIKKDIHSLSKNDKADLALRIRIYCYSDKTEDIE